MALNSATPPVCACPGGETWDASLTPKKCTCAKTTPTTAALYTWVSTPKSGSTPASSECKCQKGSKKTTTTVTNGGSTTNVTACTCPTGTTMDDSVVSGTQWCNCNSPGGVGGKIYNFSTNACECPTG